MTKSKMELPVGRSYGPLRYGSVMVIVIISKIELMRYVFH